MQCNVQWRLPEELLSPPPPRPLPGGGGGTHSLLNDFNFIFLSSFFNNFKKPILKTYPPIFMILNVDYALKLSKYIVETFYVSNES